MTASAAHAGADLHAAGSGQAAQVPYVDDAALIRGLAAFVLAVALDGDHLRAVMDRLGLDDRRARALVEAAAEAVRRAGAAHERHFRERRKLSGGSTEATARCRDERDGAWTSSQVAAALGVTEHRVRQLARAGLLGRKRNARRWEFGAGEVLALAETRSSTTR